MIRCNIFVLFFLSTLVGCQAPPTIVVNLPPPEVTIVIEDGEDEEETQDPLLAMVSWEMSPLMMTRDVDDENFIQVAQWGIDLEGDAGREAQLMDLVIEGYINSDFDVPGSTYVPYQDEGHVFEEVSGDCYLADANGNNLGAARNAVDGKYTFDEKPFTVRAGEDFSVVLWCRGVPGSLGSGEDVAVAYRLVTAANMSIQDENGDAVSIKVLSDNVSSAGTPYVFLILYGAWEQETTLEIGFTGPGDGMTVTSNSLETVVMGMNLCAAGGDVLIQEQTYSLWGFLPAAGAVGQVQILLNGGAYHVGEIQGNDMTFSAAPILIEAGTCLNQLFLINVFEDTTLEDGDNFLPIWKVGELVAEDENGDLLGMSQIFPGLDIYGGNVQFVE